MSKTVCVMFETLPKESIFIRAYRRLFGKPRENEHVRLTVNGITKIIKRGVPVKLHPVYLELADIANGDEKPIDVGSGPPYRPTSKMEMKHLKYGYEIV